MDLSAPKNVAALASKDGLDVLGSVTSSTYRGGKTMRKT